MIRINEIRDTKFMPVIPWCKQFCKRHLELEYKKLSESQHRVKNKLTGKYVDFWNTGSFRLANGKFFRIGATRRGFGLNNLDSFGDTNLDIKNEIKELLK
ncbi:MAG: hypothetical protein PHE32_04105 [Candidatus Shapirobacteria bacterium]|nr:hypothetical protein [Candidatus Shapirobacteria bacterium]